MISHRYTVETPEVESNYPIPQFPVLTSPEVVHSVLSRCTCQDFIASFRNQLSESRLTHNLLEVYIPAHKITGCLETEAKKMFRS